MQFEKITYRDLDEIRNLQPEDWADIVPDFDFYIRSKFCNPIKTEMDGNIVGVGTSILFQKTSWIAHIIVNNKYRNRGIGYQIVNELLEHVKGHSVETCSLISTELGQPVYMKAGFRAVTEYSFFKREQAWEGQPGSEKAIPFVEKYRPMIYKLDKKISGENREQLLADYLGTSIIYIENKSMLGYYIPDLKNGPIVADTDEAGLELMKIKYSTIDNAVLPSDNMAGIDFLKQNGYGLMNKRGTRMIFGKEIDWRPKKIYSRIGGNVG